MRRPLYGWLAADGVSVSGTRVSMVALPLYVLLTSGSPERTGLVAATEMLPMVLFKVLGGPVIDRIGPRRVALLCDWGSLVAVGAIPLLHESGQLSFSVLLALVAVAGALRGPGDAAKATLTPSLAATADMPVERVAGLRTSVERSASMVGAALAGVLVATVGPVNALLVDACSFGVSALILGWALPVTLRRPAPEESDPTPYAEQLREGWRFLRHDPVLVGITVMVALTNLIDLAWAAVLVPVWAIGHGGAAVMGAIFATWTGASAVGALVAAARADRLPRYWTFLICFLVMGLPRYLVMALDTPVAGIMTMAAVGGFACGFLNPIMGAVTFERVPERLLGRVGSLSTACCFALMPLGGLLGGLLVGGVGLTPALLVCGAAYFVVTTLPAVDRRWRGLDRHPAPAERAGTTDPVDPVGGSRRVASGVGRSAPGQPHAS